MRRTKTKEDKALDEALDVLIAKSGHSAEAIMGDQGLLAQLTKRLVERVLGAELTHHLKTGCSPTEQAIDEHGQRGEPEGNCRNGFSAKTVLGDSGKMDIDVPRDRHSSFEPLLVPKWQKKLLGFDEKIIALYARGMTVGSKASLKPSPPCSPKRRCRPASCTSFVTASPTAATRSAMPLPQL